MSVIYNDTVLFVFLDVQDAPGSRSEVPITVVFNSNVHNI